MESQKWREKNEGDCKQVKMGRRKAERGGRTMIKFYSVKRLFKLLNLI